MVDVGSLTWQVLPGGLGVVSVLVGAFIFGQSTVAAVMELL